MYSYAGRFIAAKACLGAAAAAAMTISCTLPAAADGPHRLETGATPTSSTPTAAAPTGATPIRVATWNIEYIGEPGTPQFQAAALVLARIGADVVAINEINGDADTEYFLALAEAVGYEHALTPGGNPFGIVKNGFLSRLPVLDFTFHTSAALSGDPRANDITRLIVEIVVQPPGEAAPLTLVTEHFQSGTLNSEEFRRACEAVRVGQTLADRRPGADAYLIMGDVNEELDTVPRTPNPFVELPTGLPISFRLGADLDALMRGPGIVNDPFHYLHRFDGPAATAVDARRLDGTDVTRPISGRRLDYVFVSLPVLSRCVQAEVYDSALERLPGGLPKFGEPLPAETSLAASDHLLVFADILAPGPDAPLPLDFDGDDDVDLKDWATLQTCFTGADGGPAGPSCQAGVIDCDDDIDGREAHGFTAAMMGPGS